MCRHSLRQFIVAMEVALSISRSWSKGERPVDDGRASMLWMRSLCWPWAWPIICHQYDRKLMLKYVPLLFIKIFVSGEFGWAPLVDRLNCAKFNTRLQKK